MKMTITIVLTILLFTITSARSIGEIDVAQEQPNIAIGQDTQLIARYARVFNPKVCPEKQYVDASGNCVEEW